MARKSKNASDEELEAKLTNQAEVTNEPIAQAPADTFTRSRCGGALSQARLAQGLSVQDVASKLRLSPKQIEAIEADDFTKLPETTIVRGFIRNYAKLLKINAEPLLDAYAVIVPSNLQHELTVKPTANMQLSTGDKPKVASYLMAGLMLLMAAAAWFFYQHYIQKPSPVKPTANVEEIVAEPLSETLPEPALPAAERAAELQTSTELSLPPAEPAAAPLEGANLPAQPNALAANPPISLPANPPVAASAGAAATVTTTATQEVAPVPAGLSKLEFSASQQTWVGIVDAEGKTIYDKIIFAGSRESVEAKLPLNVTVGNAGATVLRMDGKEIALAPHVRNNVARIKLE